MRERHDNSNEKMFTDSLFMEKVRFLFSEGEVTDDRSVRVT